MTRKVVNQKQNVTQIVKVVLGDLKKPRKKKKKKSASKPKMRSALDVARNPQPYQIPLYFPPFPSVINNQPKQPSIQKAVASALRNYNDVNTAELKRLRGDLTAYRQEAQTAFHQNVAYPRARVNIGSFDGASISDNNSVVSGSDISDIGSTSSTTTAAEPDSDFSPSASSVSSNISFGRAEGLIADMDKIIAGMYQSSESDTPSALFRKAGAGAGRLTEPDYTTDTSIASKSVKFNPVLDDFMDLTSVAESDFAPRATKQQRASRRTRTYVDNASNRRLGRVGKSY